MRACLQFRGRSLLHMQSHSAGSREGGRALKGVCHFESGGEALRGISQGPAHDDGIQFAADLCVEMRRGFADPTVDDLLGDLKVAVAFEQSPAGQGFPQDHGGRVQVRASIELASAQLLRRHVGDLPFDDPFSRLLRATRCLGNTEIHQASRAVCTHEDVLR